MTRILFRCDASLSIGSGHVIRSRTLARELTSKGAEVLFLCRRQSGDLIALLEHEFQVLSLPQLALVACEGLSSCELYAAWLGCSQEQDVVDCFQALRSAGIKHADWLVVDHYGLDARWESLMLKEQFGKAPPKLLVIDDLANRPHQSDLLLDQNFFGEATEYRYEGLLPQECRQLLGPQYSLLGPEYAQFHSLVPIRMELRRVLVFFGGVDSDNLTNLTLDALMDPACSDIAVDVVVGGQSPHRNQIETMINQRPNTTLHGPLSSLVGLIVRADLSIGAAGTTVWERACLGLPSICRPSAENQLPVSRALAKHDYASILDCDNKLYHDNLLEKINLFRSPEYISRASMRCKFLTAGRGAVLCADLLLENCSNHASLGS